MPSISKYFLGIGAKRLSEVEIKLTSNQHEFNGINELKEILGSEKTKFPTKYILLNDDENKIIEAEGLSTWYDAREKHATRTEYRLYYTHNSVIENASVGDLAIICKTNDNSLIIVVAPTNTTSEKQLLWLFGLEEIENKFITKDLTNEKEDLSYANKYILLSIGIDTDEFKEEFTELIISKFGNEFPSTSIFSAFSRSTVKASPIEEPDKTLVAWMEREELLFRTLEKIIVQEKLKAGFGENVDDFVHFSLGVQNRRKSRAGYAFENHLSTIFDSHEIEYSRGKVTELNKKPDFIFPGIQKYHDRFFNTSGLVMLGAKTSAKDRWRQVLSEAAKIKEKHLITLEPAISKNQTDEMISENLQLIIPKGIIETYSKEQQKQIFTLADFITLVNKNQKDNK